MSKITLNGKEFDLNLMDADVVEIFERETARIKTDIAEPKQYEGKSTADGLRIQCRYIDRYIDALFGEGTADAIFPKKNDLEPRLNAFAECIKASQEVVKNLNESVSRYGFTRLQNRAERRAAQKK